MASNWPKIDVIRLEVSAIVFRAKLHGYPLLSEKCKIISSQREKTMKGRLLIDVKKEGVDVFLLLESTQHLPFLKGFLADGKVSFHLVKRQQASHLLASYGKSKAMYRVGLKGVLRSLSTKLKNRG